MEMDKQKKYKVFADRLALALARVGMSQTDLSRALFVRQATVNEWCRGRRFPDPAIQGRLAEVLGESPGWLYHGESVESREQVLAELTRLSREIGEAKTIRILKAVAGE